MNLSSRALAYLATLRRVDHVPVGEVSEALKRAGCPVVDVWIDFHMRFGGYEEVIGDEIATWGIVHSAPQWLDAGEVSFELRGDMLRIVCADVHPSYDYWLNSNGEFVGLGGGAPCETFDVKIERDAMFWEATAQDRPWSLDLDLLKVAGSVDTLRRVVDAEIVAEASDKYTTCWKARDVIVIQGTEMVTTWVATDARVRLVTHLQGNNR